MLVIGIFECVAVGWFYNFHILEEKCTTKGAYIAVIGYWVSLILGIALGFHVFYEMGYVWVGIVVWLVGWAVSWAISAKMAAGNGTSFGEWAELMAYGGVREISDNILRLSFLSSNGVPVTSF